MVEIIPSTKVLIGHGAFSVVYKVRLKEVSTPLEDMHKIIE